MELSSLPGGTRTLDWITNQRPRGQRRGCWAKKASMDNPVNTGAILFLSRFPVWRLPEDRDPRGVSFKGQNRLGRPVGPATSGPARQEPRLQQSGDRQEVAHECMPCSGSAIQHEGIGDYSHECDSNHQDLGSIGLEIESHTLRLPNRPARPMGGPRKCGGRHLFRGESDERVPVKWLLLKTDRNSNWAARR
jgi:hypothetical protein